MSRKCTGMVLAAACGLAVLCGGCAGGKVTRIRSEESFREIVLQSKKPVLVDFFKGGCATCIPLDKVMDQLVDEYEGRAVIVKFETMTAFFGVPSPEIKARYDIVFFPTAVLFVNGEVKKRWIMRYSLESYREHLDKYATPATQSDTGDEAEVRAEPTVDPEMGENKAGLY